MNWYFLAWSLIQLIIVFRLITGVDDLYGFAVAVACYLIFFAFPACLLWKSAKIGF